MFRLHVGMSLVLFGLVIILVAGALVLHQPDDSLDIFMTAPENCTGICLLGITPGRSTVGEALERLSNHPWVNDVRENAPGNGFANLNWGWSGQQPAMIDTNRRGRATFYWNDEDESGSGLTGAIIETVTIYTLVRVYYFQEWFGVADAGVVNNRLDDSLGYALYYNRPGGVIHIATDIRCPAGKMSYWDARGRLTVSIGSSSNPVISPVELLDIC